MWKESASAHFHTPLKCRYTVRLLTFTYNVALSLTPRQLVLSPPPSAPTLISELWGWEYGVDGCINNAVLPGNQTRCSGVPCRILKRYLFVRGCHPPPPVPLRSPLISISILPHNCLNDHPASVSSSVCLCFKDVHCMHHKRVHE